MIKKIIINNEEFEIYPSQLIFAEKQSHCDICFMIIKNLNDIEIEFNSGNIRKFKICDKCKERYFVKVEPA